MIGVAPLVVRACAKINLTLRVLGRRADGFHDVRTVFQSIDLHDRLTFESVPGPFTIVTTQPDCPTDRTNLVWRAAELVWKAGGRRGRLEGVRVTIDKRVPMRAGLGGGSSDAAATLRALATLWCPSAPLECLQALGASLGADVPFFFHGGTALGLERGDRLFPLADVDPAWVVLAQPDFAVSTADAYRWYDDASGTEAAPAKKVSSRWSGPYGEGGNDLARAVSARHPGIDGMTRALRRHGASWAAMSGSGSVCFGLFPSLPAAESAADAMRSPRCAIVVTKTQTAGRFTRQSTPFRPVARRP